MGISPFRHLLPLCCLVLVAACGLPRGAALQSEITRDVADEELRDLSIISVSRENIGLVAGWPRTGRGHNWTPSSRGSASTAIAPGDQISLTIWDNDENSLLTAASAKAVQIQNVTVSPSGTIFLPYLAEFSVRGQTPDAVRSQIQTQFETILASPQVQLSVTAGRQNSVDLVGGVAKAGSYPLPDRSFSVLSLISAAGGVQPGLLNPQIRLVRGNEVSDISVARLFADPRLDAALRGGDKVIVEADKRTFIALGASGQQDLIPFPKDEVSVLEAVSLIGGIKDARANPRAVLVLREYPASAVRSDGSGPDRARVVFTLDLTSADGLFSARKFYLQPEDLVMATESQINSVRTVLGLLGQTLGLVRGASTL